MGLTANIWNSEGANLVQIKQRNYSKKDYPHFKWKQFDIQQLKLQQPEQM